MERAVKQAPNETLGWGDKTQMFSKKRVRVNKEGNKHLLFKAVKL